MKKLRPAPRRRSRRGMTLVELSMGIAVSSLLMIIVAGVQFISGRAINDLYNKTRTRSSQARAIDQIRYLLSEAMDVSLADFNGGKQVTIDIPTDYSIEYEDIVVTDVDGTTQTLSVKKKAQIDTAVNVTAYDTMTFRNPNLGDGITSRLRFDAPSQKLMYDNNIGNGTADERMIVTGPIDVRFVPLAYDSTAGVLANPGSRSAIVLLMVRSQAYVAYKEDGVVNGIVQYTVIDEQDGLTTVYLRNTTAGSDVPE